ncbi:MAG: PadR family transcriptional regulator [Bacteroidetes bacterium]|jgi:PadR family transcriptional regulator PadR|nr:PadR family transcriptional regulator [Bacteroidota bacterium]
MKIENTQAQMRKGILEFCILSILKNGEAYTSDILEALKSAKMIVVEGTIYPLLNRLKNADILTYRWEESTGGPPRKYYSLTEKGQKFLTELALTWDELQLAVNKITSEIKES